ncbi:DinB family protein [Paenibacillus psychroresistens]|uniref:DinB family protein n=1 Tax=Paenibacillus psychroresistens TaxID=1778678 RepID=UPI001391A2B9|nr:DinB family protein [Paenibacillus psychroresistens]
MSDIQLANINEYTELYLLLEQKLQSLNEEQLTWKSALNQWSIAEVLGHLVDATVVHYFRVRKVLAEPLLEIWPLYAQDEWVARSKVNAIPAKESLELFRSAAHYNGLFYKGLTDEDWSLSALNYKGERVTVHKLFENFITHTHIHLRQIDRIIGTLAAKA